MAVLSAFRARPRGTRRVRRGLYLLPSILTVANLFCGYACLVYTFRGDFGTAAPFIGVALVLDTLDGRIARLIGVTSAFGVEFDSLADIVSFGLAPALLVCAWGLTPFGQLGWAAGFLYLAAAATRLARFNIQSPATDKRFFVGMPSPSAASVLAATVFAYPAPLQTPAEALPVFALVLVPAFLMITTLRFWSFKSVNLGHRRSYVPLIVIASVLAAIAANPPVVLVGMAYVYLLSAPITALVVRVRRRTNTAPVRSADDAWDSALPASSGTDGPPRRR